MADDPVVKLLDFGIAKILSAEILHWVAELAYDRDVSEFIDCLTR